MTKLKSQTTHSITKNSKLFVLVVFYLLPLFTLAQSATIGEKRSVSIKISSFSSSSVTFSWTSDSIVSTSIYRKKIKSDRWSILTQNTTSLSYTDNSISDTTEYEYKFEVNTGTTPAYGYIAFGINIPEKQNRGNLLLVVDSRFETALASEIKTLKKDLIGDGWHPISTYCNKDTSVKYVKAKIDSINAVYPLNGIYLIGHIPVPYSGLIYPDGHLDHRGAWPTDLYYASDSNDWTDNTVNYPNSYRPINSNYPNDGKFDNSEIRGETFCPISRIDFYNLPKVVTNETNALKNYLSKVSSYKHGKINALDKGVIDDNLKTFNEGFSFNGHMNFSSLFGDSVIKTSLLSALQTNTYKWSYACGYGSDTSLSGLGSVNTLKNTDYKGIFSMVFGSYFGDWNTENNFMRTLLADGKMLTTCWAGRPNWFFHHMGLNNSIGVSSKMSIENGSNSSYLNTTPYEFYGNYSNGIHMQLLGDITLRLNYKTSIDSFNASFNSITGLVDLTWTPPQEELVTEYKIFKSNDPISNFTLLATLTPSDSTYSDSAIASTGNYYFISYRTLDSTNSGSYYNNSVGTFTEIDTTGQVNPSTLPIVLINFEVVKEDEKVILKWETSSEINSDHFELEKSTNTLDWTLFGQVKAAGFSNSKIDYISYDYNNQSSKTYYRLKLLDFDGSYQYSNICLISKKTNTIKVYPNPSFSNLIYLTDLSDAISKEKIRIVDSKGLEVPFILSNTDPLQIEILQNAGTYYLISNNKCIKFLIVSTNTH